VAWGDLDYLIVDSPPGTGDEPLSICQLIGKVDGAVIVTTPQKVAAVDVRKSVTFCRRLNVPVLGIVENMSGFTCPHCGITTTIFHSGGGRRIAKDMSIPFLGSIPLDPEITQACDSGQAYLQLYATTPTAAIMRDIAKPIAELQGPNAAVEERGTEEVGKKEETPARTIRLAIPVENGKLASHFGHCAHFALVDVDPERREIVNRLSVEAPPHEPGLLPGWLAERGANIVIAGGMGQRALSLFSAKGLKVIVGAPVETPERLARDYLAGSLQGGENVCDH
jgi:predicted Fe-Mo cluster-binding NifX family protein